MKITTLSLAAGAATALVLSAAAAAGGPGCASYQKGMQTAALHHAGYAQPMRAMPVGYYGQSAAQQAAAGDIVDIAASAGSFNTLVSAVQAAGLVETLKGKGPITVFAPTDAAFAKLPAGTVEALLADKEKLTRILTYHVVPGRLDASAVGGVAKLATVEGSELAVADIKIAKTDIMATNGIIHVIDEVLIPES